MKLRSKYRQAGLSLSGLIAGLVILAVIAVLAMKIAPTVTEYMAIKKAIATAKTAGTSVREIQSSFDKQAEVGYISSISSKDLEIVKNGDDIEISFAYQKKIPLVGPASLLLDYSGSTATTPGKKAAE